jgi:hypothetical protein
MEGGMTSTPPTIIPEPDPFWRKNAQKLVEGSIDTLDNTAKQLITLTALLEGLYFHAITFSDLRGTLSGWLILIYIAPIALWMASLLFAVLTLFPKTYNINIGSSRNSKEIYEQIVSKKHFRLKISAFMLVLSFLPLMLAVYYFLN